jgi:hypothetical protein
MDPFSTLLKESKLIQTEIFPENEVGLLALRLGSGVYPAEGRSV